MTDTYKLQCTCSNCNWEGEAEIKRGIPFNEAKVGCPNCNCATLTRKPAIKVVDWPDIPYRPPQVWYHTQPDRSYTIPYPPNDGRIFC